MTKSSVFHETYCSYLQEIRKINLEERAALLAGQYSNNTLRIKFYNQLFIVSSAGVFSADSSDVPFSIKVILTKYILMASDTDGTVSDHWMSYREFKDAGPLTSYFANNTNKTIEQSFDGKVLKLEEKCLSLGGNKMESESYDTSFKFNALPKIPVLLNFNDRDELFPPACSILFKNNAEKYLDMECLAMVGTYLTGLLITNKSSNA